MERAKWAGEQGHIYVKEQKGVELGYAVEEERTGKVIDLPLVL